MSKPAHKPLILIFPFGYLSHYLRCLVLARHLSPLYELRFAAHPVYDAFVRIEGFATFPCDTMDEAEVLRRARKFDFSWMNEKELEKVFLAQVSSIDSQRPFAVLGDAMPTLKMAAEKANVQYISLFNGYMSKYYAASRRLSRSHPFYQVVSQMPTFLEMIITSYGEKLAMRKVHTPFRRLRAKKGLSTRKTFLDEMEGDYNLICDLTALFPQKPLPSNYQVIGPLVYDLSHGAHGLAGKIDVNKKTLFISMGSTGDWHSVSWLNAQEFRGYNIITAGDKNAVIKGSHVVRTDFVAASEVMPFTDLVICQGGNGTIYQALSYGVPLLCQTSHFEQEWNVTALEKMGLVKSLDVQDLNRLKAIANHWAAQKDNKVYTDIKNSIAKHSSEINEKVAWLQDKLVSST